MSGKPPEPLSLRRWSRRKLEAARAAQAPAAPVPPSSSAPAAPNPVDAAVAPSPPAAVPSAAPPAAPPAPLPPIESLSIESDFAPFLQAGVDEGVRRAALKKLFADPRFNVMDGLDVYIDDYSKFTPLPPEVVAQLRHARAVLDPPRTRVNEQGFVEDVPPEAAPAERIAAPDGAATPSAPGPPAAGTTDAPAPHAPPAEPVPRGRA